MRRSGVLLPVFSLPGAEPVGTLGGAGTWRFLDFLADAGFSLWQILPVPPEGRGDCPYAGASAFAVDPALISLEDLVRDGYLRPSAWSEARRAAPSGHPPDRVPWKALRRWKQPWLRRAARAVPADQLGAYGELAAWWVDDWALWHAISQQRGVRWSGWPEELRERRPAALDAVRTADDGLYREAVALQFLADRQWSPLRRELRGRGLRLMGDLPLYVDGDGADVWAHPRLFRLGQGDGNDLVAGVPPDAFCADGQRWDNPVYDWEHSARTGHRWWRARFRRLLQLCDEIRVDHFRGFVAYYAFPAHATPRDGHWTPGPGRGLFEALADEVSQLAGPQGDGESRRLPVVVEDLGYVDHEVEALRDGLGLPGTKVMQFGFDGDPNNPHHPWHFPGPCCLACTGTHDLPTAATWYETAPEWVRRCFDEFRGDRNEAPAAALVRLTLESVADHVVIPLQDLQGLGAGARINVPGTVEGNWQWRAQQPDPGCAAWCRGLNQATGRQPVARDGQP